MKFYRLVMKHDNGSSAGFAYYTNWREASRDYREYMRPADPDDEEYVTSREGTEIDVIEIVPTKAGILRALNRYADHPDNG